MLPPPLKKTNNLSNVQVYCHENTLVMYGSIIMNNHVYIKEDRATIISKQAPAGTPTLRVAAEVVLSGRQAVSVLALLRVRNSLTAGRLFILLQT